MTSLSIQHTAIFTSQTLLEIDAICCNEFWNKGLPWNDEYDKLIIFLNEVSYLLRREMDVICGSYVRIV